MNTRATVVTVSDPSCTSDDDTGCQKQPGTLVVDSELTTSPHASRPAGLTSVTVCGPITGPPSPCEQYAGTGPARAVPPATA